MNLIIDAGNTRTKVAVFNQKRILFENTFQPTVSLKDIQQILTVHPCAWAMVSSVSNTTIATQLKNHTQLKVIQLTSETPVPFRNEYGTPKTLGVDRIALAAAAFYEFPNQNTLIIDAGTCITYDFLNAQGAYKGGAISPGLQMRYAALNHYTAKLPLIKKEKLPTQLIGDSTENSILSGVYLGIVNEIEGTIAKYQSLFQHLTVILTGGDSQILSKTLKNTIFANPKFLIQGLNHILEYNKHE